MAIATKTILALDVGLARIGVAMTLPNTTIAKPVGFISNDENFINELTNLITANQVDTLVVGLPRGLQSQETDQTAYVRDFADKLKSLGVTIEFQDEALTSRQAEDQLKQQGKPYQKGDIDAQAAAIILQDYVASISPQGMESV